MGQGSAEEGKDEVAYGEFQTSGSTRRVVVGLVDMKVETRVGRRERLAVLELETWNWRIPTLPPFGRLGGVGVSVFFVVEEDKDDIVLMQEVEEDMEVGGDLDVLFNCPILLLLLFILLFNNIEGKIDII